jgi:hypothetical protein
MAMFGKDPANIATGVALKSMAFLFNHVPEYKRHLRTDHGWINFSLRLKTEKGNVNQVISFQDGKVSVNGGSSRDADFEIMCQDNSTLKDLATLPPNEVLNLVLKSRMIEGKPRLCPDLQLLHLAHREGQADQDDASPGRGSGSPRLQGHARGSPFVEAAAGEEHEGTHP